MVDMFLLLGSKYLTGLVGRIGYNVTIAISFQPV